MLNVENLNVRERFADAFSLPKDMVANATILHMIGGSNIFLENFKGIISYTCHEIVVKGCHDKINICGDCLMIEYYSEEDMKISGHIREVKVIKGA